jgi:UDP-glucuronate 4-epimerase
MKHVLVTGGAGFIGSRLIDRLMVGGCHATVADNFDSFYPDYAQCLTRRCPTEA